MNESANKVAKLRKIKISPDIILIKHSLPSERYFRSKNSVETKRENSQEERVALTRAIKRSYPASNEPISEPATLEYCSTAIFRLIESVTEIDKRVNMITLEFATS